MYNYAPQYSNVPYIQNSAQADANVQFVFQQIGVVLRQLVQSGYIPQQIANQADMLLRQPSNQEAIRNDVIRTYGGMAVSQQDLIDYTTRRVQNMCASINQQNMRSQYYGSGGYYGGYGQPAMGTGGFRPQPTYNSQLGNYDQTTSSIWGNNQKQGELYNPLPSQSNDRNTIYGSNNHGTVQQPQRAPIDTSNIEVKEKIVIATPKWKEEEKFDAEKFADPNFITIGKMWAVQYGEKTTRVMAVRDDQVQSSPAEEVMALTLNASPIFDGDFANVIDFDEIVVGRLPFDSGRNFYEKCLDKLEHHEKPNSVGAMIDVITSLREMGEFGSFVGGILLEKFNRAASVNFLRGVIKDGKKYIVRLNPFESLNELVAFLGNQSDERFDAWKQDKDNYISALTSSLAASFTRIFHKGGYLDKDNLKDRIQILSSPRCGFRFGENYIKGPDTLALPAEQFADIKDEVEMSLEGVFALKVRQKILVHNLDLPVIKQDDFKANKLEKTQEALVLLEMLDKFGNIEMIDVNDPTQTKHPLILGMDYENRLLVRRMY